MNYLEKLNEIFSVEPIYLLEEKLKTISQQEAIDRKFFGPVYHGTTSDISKKTEDEGFKIFIGNERSGNIRHGYESGSSLGLNLPIHHLGFGVYFTTVKNIAKRFSEKGGGHTKMYYLDVPRLETINFGSHNTMMKWWVNNGFKLSSGNKIETTDDRVEATKNMTEILKNKYDAVWFKGKGLHKLLDGDQIAVFDPERIYLIDNKLANPETFDVGSKVKRKTDGMIGIIIRKEKLDAEKMLKDNPNLSAWLSLDVKYRIVVKWKKGGTDYNVLDTQVDPIVEASK